MGGWNPTKDREPDKKEEQAFKQFLISKYERKTWYKSPELVLKEEQTATVQAPKAEPKLTPPPSKVRCEMLTGAFSHSLFLLHTSFPDLILAA